MSLEVEVKARVSTATKQLLSQIAKAKGEGVKVSAVVREAIQEYLARRAAAVSTPIPFPANEEQQFRVAEEPPEKPGAPPEQNPSPGGDDKPKKIGFQARRRGQRGMAPDGRPIIITAGKYDGVPKGPIG